MRTTLVIDDELLAALKRQAFESGKPLKQVVNEALRAGLRTVTGQPAAKAYRLTPVAMGDAQAGMTIDKTLQIADQLECEELHRKLQMRK